MPRKARVEFPGVVYHLLDRFDHTQRNQLAHIYDGSWQPWFTYNYGAAGNVTRRQNVSGGVNDSQNTPDQWYDALNRPVGWENTWVGDGPFSRSWYQYDKVGREVATWRDENNGLGSGRGERYEYEPANQLKSAAYNAQNVWTGTAQNPVKTQNYTYTPDRLNRATVTENGVVTSYSAGGLNQYGAVNGAAYRYDGNFNLYDAPNWGAVYDAEKRLIYASRGGNAVFFTYDGLGRCVKRIINGTSVLMTYDGWKPILEWDGAGNFQAWNIYGPGADEILARYHPTEGQLRYHHDARGNVVAILNGFGNWLQSYSYDAFGKPTVFDYNTGANLGNTSTYGNRFLFQGREWIPELGLYDYRHRIYQPELGRFLQTDPMGLQTEGVKLSPEQKALYGAGAPEAFNSSEMNLYRYCGDDPVDGSDPLGLDTAIAVGGMRDDSVNFFGHASMALAGQGTLSSGTGTPLGASFTGFLRDQALHRYTHVYILKTTSDQENAMRKNYEQSAKKALPDVFKNPKAAHNDNCTTRVADALRAGGQDVGHPKFPGQLADRLDRKVWNGTATKVYVPQQEKPVLPEVTRKFDK